MIPIVLTGTIIPNSIKVEHQNWEKRRREYIEAIKYYRSFSNKVYFIENSDYKLTEDSDFCASNGFIVLQYNKSQGYEQGKGFQEFEMLDAFVKGDLHEDCFLKITGRYTYTNFDSIFSFVLNNKKYELIIDSFLRSKTALTSIFYIKKSTYINRFNKLYLKMDDSINVYAEHVVYSNLTNIKHTFFGSTPILNAISGSTGKIIATNKDILKLGLKDAQRRIFRTLNIKKILI